MVAIYHADQIAAFAIGAGFTGGDVVTAVAVALAESGGDTEATHQNNDGSTDYGLWQINSVHRELLAGKQWKDPLVNAQMAYEVWKGSGWRAWSTYNNGMILVHMPAAIAGARNPARNLPPPTLPSVGGPSSTEQIVQFAGMLRDPKTWRRVGLFLGGTVLMVLGMRPLLKGAL